MLPSGGILADYIALFINQLQLGYSWTHLHSLGGTGRIICLQVRRRHQSYPPQALQPTGELSWQRLKPSPATGGQHYQNQTARLVLVYVTGVTWADRQLSFVDLA